MRKTIQKQLGEILVEKKIITPENLEKALATQKTKGGLLGKILIEMGMVTEEIIAKTLTAQYGFPFLPLAGYQIDPAVCKLVPEEMAKNYELIAVDKVGAILTLAMSNPLNQEAIEAIETKTHLKVQVFISTSQDIHEAIKRSYTA